jgi:uncharacterized caspase-like protein
MTPVWIVPLVCLVSLLALDGIANNAIAQKRVALIVGNSANQHTAELPNPRNDAADMAAALRVLGFQVIEGFDVDKVAFDRKVRDFAVALKGADSGLFFYAGHGLQVGGQNYLFPTDARTETIDALDFEMVRADVVQRIMEQSTNTNILFIDACRNNPLGRNLARAMGTRSAPIERGLRGMESGIGTLISFSTAPNTVAADGEGRNSPYTSALVRHISRSNEDLAGILVAVRIEVIKATQNAQVPWEHSALIGRYYFNSATPQPVVEGTARVDPLPEPRALLDAKSQSKSHQLLNKKGRSDAATPIPHPEQTAMLIQTAVVALSQANLTGNFNVLHALGAPSFQEANPPVKLAKIFKNLREQNIDLTPVILFSPVLLREPVITEQGMLHLVGYYKTTPQQVNFEVLFQPIQGQWRLFGISVRTTPAATATNQTSASRPDLGAKKK